MDLEKIYGSRGVTAALRAQHASSEKEETSDAFARILQNLRESKPANSRDRSDAEGDTIVTRVLADGSVIVRVYKGTKLISETMTRGESRGGQGDHHRADREAEARFHRRDAEPAARVEGGAELDRHGGAREHYAVTMK